MRALKKWAPQALSDKKRKQWFNRVTTIIEASTITDHQKEALSAILYRNYVATDRTRLANFLYHLISLWQYATAYLIRGAPTLVALCKNTEGLSPLERAKNMGEYLATALFVGLSAYWLVIYNSLPGNHKTQECPTDCLDVHHTNHHLVEECMLTLTRCACLPMDEGYHAYFSQATFLIKWLGITLLLGLAFMSGYNWDAKSMVQDRNITRHYWNAELLRVLETLFFSIYAGAMYGASAIDHCVLAARYITAASQLLKQLCTTQPHQRLAEEETSITPRHTAQRAVQNTLSQLAGQHYSLFTQARPELIQREEALLQLLK